MSRKTKDFIIIGFALFSLFFGAGNLIFPPKLGQLVGIHYYLGIIGFCATGVLIPFLGLVACIKNHGNFEELSLPVGKKFSKIFSIILVLLIGPLIAIPRTVATTFSLAIQPNFHNSNIIEFLVVFLLIDFFLVIRPSSIIELVGTYLTPILLIILLGLIIKGVISPISTYSTFQPINAFSKSLTEGYETMDTIASIIFASLIMGTIKKKGYKREEKIILVAKSSIIAIIGLCVVYGGLIYLGSRTGTLGNNMSNATLLLFISKQLLGKLGTIGIEVVLAIGCIATSIGLLSASAEFFVRISNHKIKYNYAVIAMLIVTGFIASAGLGKIISISTVILDIAYPVTIVIIILNLIKPIIKSNFVFKLCAYVTLIVSILDEIPSLAPIMKHIPLTNLGFGWVLPFIISFIIGNLIFAKNIDDDNDTNYTGELTT
ncbi:MAG: branched-chain amino acid transport system II carrier protein [Sarcina sp.]